ncbi:MAG: 30S ribosomal protein S17 [Candidatus Shikimatogenerans sp. AspAUS03]|uniref:30S ribosomal protein S17 n=1 Tax=Candidatus Shikimatogenerans sp. AspAUS03 TaxID=3158563 RepID=A0AAU7QSS3_9FLAO
MINIKTGTVISTKMNKTCIVIIKYIKKNKKYKKNIFYHKKYYAHDEYNKYKTGDIVIIKNIRPLSKTKRWLIIKKK